MQTQTSFADSDSSFEFEPDRVSLRSVLHRMSSIFHSYLGGGGAGGLSRQGSRRETPSPSASNASGNVSRQSSTRRTTGTGGRSSVHRHSSNRNSVLLDVLLPGAGSGSRRSSIWSLGTMIVSAQIHNECPAGNAPSIGRRGSTSSRIELPTATIGSPVDSSSISRHHSASALSPPETADRSISNCGGLRSLSPPRPRSEVIVKLTSASKDRDLNF